LALNKIKDKIVLIEVMESILL